MVRKMSRPKLFLDFDNTIVDTIAAVVSLYNEDYVNHDGFVAINPKDVTSWEFTECNLATYEEIDRYFGKKFGVELILCKNYDKSHVDMSNSIFVDDSIRNLETSSAKYKILYGEYMDWNNTNIEFIRCKNWLDLNNQICLIERF